MSVSYLEDTPSFEYYQIVMLMKTRAKKKWHEILLMMIIPNEEFAFVFRLPRLSAHIQRICSHHGQTTVKWSHKVYCQVICQINRLCAWHLSHRPDSRPCPPIPWILITLTYIHLDTLPSTHDIFSTLKIFSSFMQQPWWRLLRVSLMQKGLGGWFYCRQRLTEAVRQKSQFL